MIPDFVMEACNLRVITGRLNNQIVLIDDLSLFLKPGEILGLTGESGAGKSLTALAMCGLLLPPVRWLKGEINLCGKKIVPENPKAWADLRGKDIFLIFQSPASALNPNLKIGIQIREALVEVNGLSVKEADKMISRLLVGVGLSLSAGSSYPYQLSGGMRQRVLLAIAIGLKPQVVVADEPTSGLDPIHQAAILDLLKTLTKDHGSGLILISHDLRVLSRMADRIGVLHKGRLVEVNPSQDILQFPKHQQTMRLVESYNELSVNGHTFVGSN